MRSVPLCCVFLLVTCSSCLPVRERQRVPSKRHAVLDRLDAVNLDSSSAEGHSINSEARREFLKGLEKNLARAVYSADSAELPLTEDILRNELSSSRSRPSQRFSRQSISPSIQTIALSERGKRNLPSPDLNDIGGQSSEKSHSGATTESHIEVLLKPAATDKAEGAAPGGGSDSGGFLGGLLSSLIAGASATSSGGSGDGGGSSGFFSKLIQVKLALLRSVFSIVSGLLSSSSQG